MKIHRVSEGKFSEIKLEDGKKIFLSVLPDRITASRMVFSVPTKKVWEFVFPFYIRTAIGSWDSSKAILKVVLESIDRVENLEELIHCLETETEEALERYVSEHGEEAREISVDKVGVHALKQVINSEALKALDILDEYGKVLEIVSQEEEAKKYPHCEYPQSLLPYPKETIRKALEDTLQNTYDINKRETLKVGLVHLDSFIDDEEANQKNSEYLRLVSETKHLLENPPNT